MTRKRKWKSGGDARSIHPRNKYADNPPDFELLDSLYPNFKPYVFYSRDGRAKIDWTNFDATRELTRVLLAHDHGLDWWIPDGQLCPTVPNRSNYIHWIEDLLASEVIPGNKAGDDLIGFDIGTGANCIYPLLGASLLGWKFVGSDITDIAIEWATRNVNSNQHISELIEIRGVDGRSCILCMTEQHSVQEYVSEYDVNSWNGKTPEIHCDTSSLLRACANIKTSYFGPPILLGVVKDDENFDFCMCNPPFFETMEEVGLNPNTSCGGTSEEMVCPGGELAFITRIIYDSVKLKHKFRWFTSMVGRKSNRSILVSELWDAGVTIVKTTEFVQGRTSRWGLAWSFLTASKKKTVSHRMEKSNLSFMLEGLQRQCSAFDVLQSMKSLLANSEATCKLDSGAFRIDITATEDQCSKILKIQTSNKNEADTSHLEVETSSQSANHHNQLDALCFRVMVFQQCPGVLLVRGMLHERESSKPGLFSLIFKQLEEVLRDKLFGERVL